MLAVSQADSVKMAEQAKATSTRVEGALKSLRDAAASASTEVEEDNDATEAANGKSASESAPTDTAAAGTIDQFPEQVWGTHQVFYFLSIENLQLDLTSFTSCHL